MSPGTLGGTCEPWFMGTQSESRLTPANITSIDSGNAVSCAAAVAVQDVVRSDLPLGTLCFLTVFCTPLSVPKRGHSWQRQRSVCSAFRCPARHRLVAEDLAPHR